MPFLKGHGAYPGTERTQFKKGQTAWNKKNIDETCSNCGRIYHLAPSRSRLSKNHFCSVRCKAEWQRENLRGPNNPNFVPNKRQRPSEALKETVLWDLWRKSVFTRDNYKCQNPNCEGKTTELVPHHIKSKQVYPKLTYDLSNGVTLCVICHKHLHKLLPANQHLIRDTYPIEVLLPTSDLNCLLVNTRTSRNASAKTRTRTTPKPTVLT